MDSFELNKILGAILGTLLFVMGVGFLAEAIYSPIEGRGVGYALPEPEVVEVAAESPATTAPAVPLGALLANASVDQGATAARKCQACHNFEAGTGHKQGPELYDVVNNAIAHHEDFAYSDALLQLRADGEVWSYEHLDAFLFAPRDFAPGTKMNFAGVKSDQERANILAYMGSLSASPAPFPPADDPVPTAADAIETPTETQTDTPVEGTPITEAPLVTEPEALESEATTGTDPEEEPETEADAPASQNLSAPGQ